MDLQNWIPTLVAGGAMTYIWFDIRAFKKEMATKKKRLEDEFLTNEKHDLLCENRGLRVAERISVLEQKMDDGFKHLGEMIIKNGNGHK